MKRNGLSFNSRKALMNNIGEAAGTEIANLIADMAAEIDELRRSKVNVTRIVPPTPVNANVVTSAKSVSRSNTRTRQRPCSFARLPANQRTALT